MVTTRRQSKLESSYQSSDSSPNSPSGDTHRLRSSPSKKKKAGNFFVNESIRSSEMKVQFESVLDERNGDYRQLSSKIEEINRSERAQMPLEPNWRKDKQNIMLLFFLYILQGIPLGFSGSVPYILMTRNVDYKAQALFSFAFYPFSVKLLWAPLVDSVFSRKMGRRKTWLIPVQYLIGIFMLYISFQVHELLGLDGQPAQINLLVFLFTSLNFFAATQDIAVDGWALNILSPQNVGYASTCNSVGQTAGYFISYTVFLAFESKDFCNQYFYPLLGMSAQETGILTIDGFMYFWGIVFIICTTLVWIFKHEKDDECCDDLVETYRSLWKLLWLPALKQYIFFCLTCRIGFAAAEGMTGLKLVEVGMSKEKMALLAVVLTPVHLILPFLISKITAGPKPMSKAWIKAYPIRLLFGFLFVAIVHLAYRVQITPGEFPLWFYVFIVVVFIAHQVFTNIMFVAMMAFHAQISDPVLGGTYMTMLNTFTNLGGNWPTTVALYIVDQFTSKSCSIGNFDCSTQESLSQCIAQEGAVCNTIVDGYYVLSFVLVIVGFVWFFAMRNRVVRFQSMGLSAWKVS